MRGKSREMVWDMSWVATIITGGASAVIAFATFWMALSHRISSAGATSKSAVDSASSAASMAMSNLLKVEAVGREVNELRVEMTGRVAALEQRTQSTALALLQTEERLAKSIEIVGEKVDKLGETIIRSLTQMETIRSSQQR